MGDCRGYQVNIRYLEVTNMLLSFEKVTEVWWDKPLEMDQEYMLGLFNKLTQQVIELGMRLY